MCVSVLLCGFTAEPARGASKKINQFTDIGYDLGGAYTEYLDYALEHAFVFGTSEFVFSPDRRITWGGNDHNSGPRSRKRFQEKASADSRETVLQSVCFLGEKQRASENIEATADLAEQSVTREQTAILICNYLDCFGLWREFPVRSETVYRDLGEASPIACGGYLGRAGRLSGF